MPSFSDGMAAIFRDTFGEDVTYTVRGGSPVAIVGIVEMPAIVVDGATEIGLVAADVWLHVATDDLPAGYGEHDAVVARGRAYATRTPMPDGRGMIKIPLARV